MKWSVHMECTGEKRYTYRISVVKPEKKTLLERPSHRWGYNIKAGSFDRGLK
jgi:hypothetical protein